MTQQELTLKIQEDHEKLLELLGDGEFEFLDFMSTISEYTHAHFLREEALMYELQYPAKEDHRGRHLDIQESLLDALKQVIHNRSLKDEMLLRCKRLLQNHMEEADQKFNQFLREKTGTFIQI